MQLLLLDRPLTFYGGTFFTTSPLCRVFQRLSFDATGPNLSPPGLHQLIPLYFSIGF
jgi:hypothetical protein